MVAIPSPCQGVRNPELGPCVRQLGFGDGGIDESIDLGCQLLSLLGQLLALEKRPDPPIRVVIEVLEWLANTRTRIEIPTVDGV